MMNTDSTINSGKLTLIDGTILDAYYKKENLINSEKEPETIKNSEKEDGYKLELYTRKSMSRKKALKKNKRDRSKESKIIDSIKEEKKKNLQLFIDNAFFLFAHKDIILNDSRMFLTQVPIISSIAYTPPAGNTYPTVGIMIQWWLDSIEAFKVHDDNNAELVTSFSGSPLSGSNNTNAVTMKNEIIISKPEFFHRLYVPFFRINLWYYEAKEIYEAYTIQETLDLLHSRYKTQEEEEMFVKSSLLEILNSRLRRNRYDLRTSNETLRQQLKMTIIATQEEKIMTFYEEYQENAVLTEKKINELSEQKHALKKRLKSGEIDNKEYQEKYKTIEDEKSSLEYKLRDSLYITMRKLYGHFKSLYNIRYHFYTLKDLEEFVKFKKEVLDEARNKNIESLRLHS